MPRASGGAEDLSGQSAREIARAFLALYLTLPNYANNFLRLGLTKPILKMAEARSSSTLSLRGVI